MKQQVGALDFLYEYANHLRPVIGEGRVKDLGGGYITVTFGKAEKRFLFPDAFDNGFLTSEQ